MDAKMLQEQLQTYPGLLAKAEKEYHESLHVLAKLKFDLLELESELLNDGIKKEKSDMVRNAALFPHTKYLLLEILKQEEQRDFAKIEYHKVKKECEHLEYLARLML